MTSTGDGRGAEAYGPDGRAALPFWTRRLLLQRQGGGVTATVTADGDGHGWADQGR
jgi:hypothetical protein